MTSSLDIKDTGFIDLRSDKIILFRNKCKRGKNIQCSYCLGSLLNAQDLLSDFITDIRKQFILQCIQTIFCTKDQILQFFEFLRDIALCIGQCLFSHIIIRHLILEGICNLQRISEYTAVFDLKRFDPGTFLLTGFQLCQPLLAVCSGAAVFVNICMISFTDNAAVFLCQRRFIYDRTPDQICDVLKRIHILIDLLQDRCLKLTQDLTDKRDHCQRRSKCNHISRICGLIADPADQSLQIVDRIEIFSDLVTEHRLLCQFLYRRQSLPDFCGIDQRLLHIAS